MSLQRCKRLTEGQKGTILARHSLGQSFEQISGDMRIPKSTITSFVCRSRKRDSIDNLPQTGRPRNSSVQDDRLLVRKALANTRVPLQQLRVESNSNLSKWTIQCRLKDCNIQKHKAAKLAHLTQKHAAAHFKWAKCWKLESLSRRHTLFMKR